MAGALICETVTGADMAELRGNRDAATRADLVELRLDGVRGLDVAGALDGRSKPVVVTCRPSWDGGRFTGAEETRLGLLAEAVARGAEYVDVELLADWQRVPRGERTGLVLSFHDWKGVPADLADRVRAMRQARPAIVKVAVTAQRLSDCIRIRAAGPAESGQVSIAMGGLGQMTRTCPWLFGSCWTYAGASAPGQLPADVLVDRYRVRNGSAATALYGVAGRPLAHSASPAMHNAAFAAAGMDAVYVPFEGESVEEVDEVATAFGVRGLSVTAPFKQRVLARAAQADDRTIRLGAANTLRRGDGGWHAHNFDVEGFIGPLERRGLALQGWRVLVLGAGGAARAVVLGLREGGAAVTVSARNSARAARVARGLGAESSPWPPDGRWDLVVNATPAGTWPDVDAAPLPPGQVSSALAYDLVYNPPETAWLRGMRETGGAVIGGLEMLVEQACRQFEWWTAQAAPRPVVEAAARRFVTEEVQKTHATDDV